MFKIIVTDKISNQGMSILKDAGFQVDEKIGLSTQDLKNVLPGYDGWIIRSGTQCTSDLIGSATHLKFIGRAGSGVDNIDMDAAKRCSITVMNTPDCNTVSAAELTVALLMSMARQIPQANGSMHACKWERQKFMGIELAHKIVGIIGLGRIGTHVAGKVMGLGMKVLWYDPYVDPHKLTGPGIERVDLPDLIKRSDFITVHTPLNSETKGMIGTREFASMKDGVYIINCARGGICDEVALYDALKTGKVASAALDVYEKEPPVDNPLLTLDNVICVPHLGARTKEAQERVSVEIATQMVDAMKDGRVRHAVNFGM